MRTALSRNRARNPSSILSDIEQCTDRSSDEESLQQQRSDSALGKNSLISRATFLLHQNKSEEKRRNTIIRILKDIVGGIMLGAFGMSILLLLDYRNIVNLETARVFRKTASELFSSPEMFETIEGELEMKLISMDAYNAMKKELSDSEVVLEDEKSLFGARSVKETSLKSELASLKVERDKLIKQSGLDAFCPECKWGMGLNCQQRVEYMLQAYSDTATYIGCVNKLVDEGKTKKRCLYPSFQV